MKLYLAGPMSGIPDLNFPLFHSEAARLRAIGFEIINPAEINLDPHANWGDCMRADIPQLLTCEGIAMLPNWHNSKGARLEWHIAVSLDMRVFMADNLRWGAKVPA